MHSSISLLYRIKIVFFILSANIFLFAQVDFSTLEIPKRSEPQISLNNVEVMQKVSVSSISIGDYVWYDHNQNGLQDLGELGVYGVELKLFDDPDCSGNEIASTRSSDVGYYEFSNLPASGTNYCIEVVYPLHWTHTVNSNVINIPGGKGKIPNIVLKNNNSYDIGLQHEDINCQVPTLNSTDIGTFDNSNSWAKRATLDVEFKNVTVSAYCHEYSDRGPERGEHYTVHNSDRKGFSELQRDRLSRVFRFMTDSDIISRVEKTFSDKNLEIFFNISNNALIWYYSDWKNDFSKVISYIDNSSWSDQLSIAEKSSLKDIAKLIIDRVEGVNGEIQYESMRVYYLWNEDNINHQDLIAPETLVVPKKQECIAPLNSSTLGDFVWFDADKNGKQDVGESGIENVSVELYDGSKTLKATTLTDKNGAYLFKNLDAGEYVVKFNTPKNYTLTTPNAQGVSGSLNSDANSQTGESSIILLHEDEKKSDIDAGIYITPKPSIKIVKTTNNGEVENILVGDNIVWRYLITNTGNETLTNLHIIDDKEGEITDCVGDGSLESLNPTKSISCSKTGVAILGEYKNIVTVVANDSTNKKITAEDSSSYVGKEVPVQFASVGDYVWLDTNRDGIQDADELPLSFITVELFNSSKKLISTTKTDENGQYSFKSLIAGKYYIKFTVPSAYSVTIMGEGSSDKDSDCDSSGKTALFSLVEGEDKKDIDMGLYPTLVNLGDRVWLDTNVNGIQDKDEKEGVAGVTVKLYREDNSFVKETKTLSSGQYLFRNLTPGNYYVVFETPNSYKVSPKNQGKNESDDSDADQTTGKTAVISLFAGRDNKTVDMGLYQESTKVGDRVFYDTNKNGIQDQGESGVADVTVKLYSVDKAEPIAITKTSASGIYLFKDIAPGEYYIVFTAPAGYTISKQGEGTVNSDSNPDSTGKTANFTLVAGMQDSSIDMGIYQDVVSFGDKVFLDTNHNGLQDIGEPGVRDVNVTIFSANSDFTKSMLTDENGNYLFTHLAAGEYSVEFSNIPYGHLITQKDVNNNQNDLDDSDGFMQNDKVITEVVLLTPGKNDLSWDLGIYKTVCLPGKAVLGNLVWEDFNKDGIQDIGERGVADVVVTLFNNDTDEKVESTKTDENGLYEFAHVDPNYNYYVQFSVPAGYVVSPQNQDEESIDSDADATGKTEVINLIADQINATVDMGIYHEGATIGDRVWFDELGGKSNGLQDAGEQGVYDVKVTLYSADGSIIKTTRTNVSGEYHFTNIDKGRYSVGFSELPSGYIFTLSNQGNDEERDSNVNSNGRTEIFVVNGTSIITSIDAGLRKLNTGTASNDIEQGIAGQDVTINILVNDTEGSYDFDTTTVRITTIPEGATLSEDGRVLTVPNEGVWRVNPETGAITFTPIEGFVGDPTPISYSVLDRNGNETGAEVSVNYPPLAVDDYVNAEVGKQIVIYVLENDSNTSSPLDKTSVRLIDPITGEEVETIIVAGEGTWNTNIDGSITFTPEDGFVANPTPIEYIVREVAGDVSKRALVTIIYPDAVDDTVVIPIGEQGEVVTVNVSENDSNNTISTEVTIGCQQPGVRRLVIENEGTWSVDDNGLVSFAPLASFMGDPTDIQYTIGLLSGERSNCATVDIRHELLAMDDHSTLNVGGQTLISVLNNDYGSLNVETVELMLPLTSVEGSTLSDDREILTVPGEGVWSVDDQGVVTFTANEGFTNAPTPIRYTVENNSGARSNVANIILTEGGLSVVANDDIGTANGGEPIVIDVLENDRGDINRSSVRIIDLNGNEVSSLVIEGEGTWSVDDNGLITFTGTPGFTGTPTPIRYIVHDNSVVLSDTATVTIRGTCVCTPYETSIPAMGQLATIVIVILTMVFAALFFKEEENIFS